MPWDYSNVRNWELAKAGPRMGLPAYHSGLYKRAIVLLQDENFDSLGRASAANALQKAVSNAHESCTADSRPEPTVQESKSAAQLSSDKENQRRGNHHAKLLKQQLRRQRQEQRHEENKLMWQRRHEQKVKLRQEQLDQQVKHQRQQQDEKLQQLEHQKQGLCQQLQQHKQGAAAVMEATQGDRKDMVATPLENLHRVQKRKATVEAQFAKASQAGEHMSRRAASIEPEDGECTPSPSAVQQAQNAARHHAVAHPPPVMQALPPPPPAATIRPDVRYQVKDAHVRKAAGLHSAGQAEYSAQQYPDTPLPPPPPLH